MNHALLKRRPRLAYPFTMLTEPNVVRLVTGEDYRYTLVAPDLETWLPDLIARAVVDVVPMGSAR